MHLLDVAVQRAGPLPLRGELLLRSPAMRTVTTIDSGTVTSEIAASSGLIQKHHHQHAEDGEHRGEELAQPLLERGRHVVDVVGDAAQDVAVRVAVEVLQRQPRQLGLHVAAHAVDGALRDPGHDVALRPAEDGPEQVERAQRARGSPRAALKSIPCPGRHVHARQHLRELALAVTPAGPRSPAPWSCPAGKLLPMIPLKMHVGRVADDLRGASTAKATLPAPSTVPTMATSRYSGRSRPRSWRRVSTQVPGAVPAGRPSSCRRGRRSRRPGRAPPAGAAADHAAASPSCESTISR